MHYQPKNIKDAPSVLHQLNPRPNSILLKRKKNSGTQLVYNTEKIPGLN